MSQFYFSFDANAAAKVGSSNRIATCQFVPVKITQAYWGVSQNDVKFLAVNFVNKEGETADEIKLYFENSNGERLSGYNQINAILAFNGIQGLNQVQGQYKAYDFDKGGVVDKQGLIAPEIVGAYVGVVLSENYYSGQNGIKYILNLSAVFHHGTQQTAKQFMEGTPAIGGQIEQACDHARKLSHDSHAKASGVSSQSQKPIGMGSSVYQPMNTQASQKQVSDDDMPF